MEKSFSFFISFLLITSKVSFCQENRALSIQSFNACSDVSFKGVNIDVGIYQESEDEHRFLGIIDLDMSIIKDVKLTTTIYRIDEGTELPIQNSILEDACPSLKRFYGASLKKFVSNCVEGSCLNNTQDGPVCPIPAGTYKVDLSKEEVDKDVTENLKAFFPLGMYLVNFSYYYLNNNNNIELVGCYKSKFLIYEKE